MFINKLWAPKTDNSNDLTAMLQVNQELSQANAHDAKLVPLFLTQLRSQDPIDPSKSQTISPASLPTSSIA